MSVVEHSSLSCLHAPSPVPMHAVVSRIRTYVGRLLSIHIAREPTHCIRLPECALSLLLRHTYLGRVHSHLCIYPSVYLQTTD